jgi:hypothetical protein
MFKEITETLRQQRWDDHRYYHHSRINQFLHLISATSFLVAYVYLFIDPIVSAYIAWLISMTSRQIGHFVFEPKSYDEYNKATQEYKEEIKIGYNLNRKRVLMSLFVLIPILAYFDFAFMNYMVPDQNTETFLNRLGIGWFWLGISAILFRMIQLTIFQSFEVAFVWCLKIVTDPIHDLWIYRKSPYYLMRGELIDKDLKQDYELEIGIKK